MKTTFNQADRINLIRRIQCINEGSKSQWGKMTACQMLRHCTMWEEMLLGKQIYKQSFTGRLFGKIALNSMLKADELKRSMPTVPSFVITGEGSIEAEKQKWIVLLSEHNDREPVSFVHPFFGKMNIAHAGQIAYKHADHHLRQFGV